MRNSVQPSARSARVWPSVAAACCMIDHSTVFRCTGCTISVFTSGFFVAVCRAFQLWNPCSAVWNWWSSHSSSLDALSIATCQNWSPPWSTMSDSSSCRASTFPLFRFSRSRFVIGNSTSPSIFPMYRASIASTRS